MTASARGQVKVSPAQAASALGFLEQQQAVYAANAMVSRLEAQLRQPFAREAPAGQLHCQIPYRLLPSLRHGLGRCDLGLNLGRLSPNLLADRHERNTAGPMRRERLLSIKEETSGGGLNSCRC